MKDGLAAAAGQVCHCMSWPTPTGRADVDLGDQHVDGIELGDRCGGGGGRRPPSGQQRGNAAGGDRNPEHNKTRGFHTLHFPQ